MKLEVLFNNFPSLKNDEIELKKIELSNLDDVYSIYSNDRVFEYCGIIPKHNLDTVRNMIGHFERDYNKKANVKLGIFVNTSSEKLVGIIEVFNLNPKVDMVTIGYFLNEQYWGKGIASKAVKLLVEFLINKVCVNRIQAEVMPANDISKRVLLRNGFNKEGTLRQANFWSGKGVVDLEIYGLLKADIH